MRDHVHLILTPSSLVPVEKAIQFINGGFSFRAKKEMNFNGEIWQKGYNEQRIKHAHDYTEKAAYIRMNPVKAGYVNHPEQFPYSSARLLTEIDPPPAHFHLNPRV
jgi:putative transposase